MTIDANALLRTLGGISGPGLPSASGLAKTGGTDAGAGLDFAKLLTKARAGEIHSGIKVSAVRDANVQLTDDQLSRLSAAADLAEANGIGRGLFLIDGKHVVMDVGSRQVLGEVSPAQAGVVEGVDGVVNVPAASDSSLAGAATIAPGTGLAPMSNPSLLQALIDRGTRAA
jgi:hypothetical protein